MFIRFGTAARLGLGPTCRRPLNGGCSVSPRIVAGPLFANLLSCHNDPAEERSGHVDDRFREMLETFANQYPNRDYTIQIV